MDPMEKLEKSPKLTTLGDLISYYYDKFSELYDTPELRNLAIATTLDDILSRSNKG